MTDDGWKELHITYYLWMIVSPILVTFGTIGNSLSIAVLARKSMRSSSPSVYLIALALADISVLFTGLLPQCIFLVSGVDIRLISSLGCKIDTWLSYTFLDISAWVQMAFTVERILSVFRPHRVKSYCTRMTSLLVPIGIVVVMMALNGHMLYGFGHITEQVKNESITIKCYYLTNEYATFFTTVWPWIDFSAYSLIPGVILTVGNSCIARRLFLRRRQLRRVSAREVPTGCSEVRIAAVSTSCERPLAASSRCDRTSSMTVILLVLNLVFLVTTFPACLFQIVPTTGNPDQTQSSKEKAELGLSFAGVTLIMYINNSFNFILYCVTGSRFREELVKMFKELQFWSVKTAIRSHEDKESVKRHHLKATT